jgi:hypothetical protein
MQCFLWNISRLVLHVIFLMQCFLCNVFYAMLINAMLLMPCYSIQCSFSMLLRQYSWCNVVLCLAIYFSAIFFKQFLKQYFFVLRSTLLLVLKKHIVKVYWCNVSIEIFLAYIVCNVFGVKFFDVMFSDVMFSDVMFLDATLIQCWFACNVFGEKFLVWHFKGWYGMQCFFDEIC